jgi:hypothetical protein
MAALALTGCGDKCTASNCAGCCDASQTCQDPSPSHCGAQGAACSSCLAIQVCALGVCQFGGGNNGGTTAATTDTHGASSTGGTTSTGSTGTTAHSTGGSSTTTSSGSTGTTGSCAANGAPCDSAGACCSQTCASGFCGPALSCAGDACAVGQAYGGCCGAAPYCGGRDSSAQPAACQAACNPAGKSCIHTSDCCAGLSCAQGLCAVPTCAGDACSAGQGAGGCCADAPDCVGPGGGALQCAAACGALNDRCAGTSDCCSSLSCTGGFCAYPTCAGSFCNTNYNYGGCCQAAPNCVNNSCTGQCGQLHDYCYMDSDCCNGVCVTDGTDAYTHCTAICASQSCTYGFASGGCCPSAQYCVNYSCSPSCGASGAACGADSDCCYPDTCANGSCSNSQCSGQTCSAGHASGGCCANAPYCTSYYSQPQRCAVSCGQASMRCSSAGDCCSGNCAINNSDGLLHCK